MKNIILLFLFLIPVFLFAQYPATGNKSRLGYQTTGDGLIWRGVAADTAIKPRTTANAYFQLDTVNRVLRRYIATQGSWQVVGGGSASIDSLIYATRYWVGSNFFPLEGGTLTGTSGAGFIGLPSQGTAPGTPASGLNIFAQGSSFNWKGTDGFERQITSSLTGGRNYALPDINGTFALGTGTADRSGRWTGTNTLGAGSWSDNLTRLPVQFQSVTTAGLPTGVTGYTVYNTTIGGLGWYDGTRWNYVPKADRSAFTATYIPFANSSGQLTEKAALYTNANELAHIGGSSYIGFSAGSSASVYGGLYWIHGSNLLQISTTGNRNILLSNGSTLSLRDATQTRWDVYITGGRTVGLGLIRDVDYYGMEMGESAAKGGGFYWRNTLERLNITTIGNSFPIEYGNNWMYMETNGRIGVGNTSPQRTFHITGEARITDLTTDAPTQIVGADADGDLGALALSGLSISGGTLTGQNIGNTDLTLSGNRTLTGAGYWLKYPNMEFNIGDTTWLFSKGVRPYLYARSKTYKPGRDSVAGQIILSTNGPQASLQLYGSANAGNNFSGAIFLYDQSANTAKNKGWFIANDQRDLSENGLNFKQVGTGASGFVSHFIMRNNGTFNVGNPTYSPAMAVAHDTFMVGKLPMINENIGLNAAYTEAPFKVVNLGIVGSPSAENKVIFNALISSQRHGSGASTAAAISKTQSNYIAGWATDGTVLDLERKRDTTIFLTADTDYNFSSAVTTAQIASRYNRIIIHMTLTSGVGADKTTTLHTPDANLMQCEILIRGTDNTGTYDNEIAFGTNNAISSDGTNTSGYTLAQGQGLHVRVVYNGSAHKYIYY